MQKNIIEQMLSKPIESLHLIRKMPPNREALLLYRDLYKFFRFFNWTNEKGILWYDMRGWSQPVQL